MPLRGFLYLAVHDGQFVVVRNHDVRLTGLADDSNCDISELGPIPREPTEKAERFIQSALREWAYARAYDNSSQRGEYLPRWLHQYNWHRPHASLKYQTPIQSLNIPMNNLVGLHR